MKTSAAELVEQIKSRPESFFVARSERNYDLFLDLYEQVGYAPRGPDEIARWSPAETYDRCHHTAVWVFWNESPYFRRAGVPQAQSAEDYEGYGCGRFGVRGGLRYPSEAYIHGQHLTVSSFSIYAWILVSDYL